MVTLLASCTDEPPLEDPYDPNGPCWPLDWEEGGEIELGTGAVDFEPMPGELSAAFGGQADPYLLVNARIRGIPPGDPNNIFEPTNPRTRANAVIEELGLEIGGTCPFRVGYRASSNGAFQLSSALRIGFGTFPLDQVAGKQARITIEVIGANRRHARAEKLVTIVAP